MVVRLLLLLSLSFASLVSAQHKYEHKPKEERETTFEYSLLLGTSANKVETLLDGGDQPPANTSDWTAAPFLGVGVHGNYGDHQNHQFGLVASYSTADGDALWSFRPLDYRYELFDSFRLKGFFGVARYDQATSAHGYYLGGGAEWRFAGDQLGINIEAAYGDKIARDRVLPSDPPATGTPEIFYDIYLLNTYLAWYF